MRRLKPRGLERSLDYGGRPHSSARDFSRCFNVPSSRVKGRCLSRKTICPTNAITRPALGLFRGSETEHMRP